MGTKTFGGGAKHQARIEASIARKKKIKYIRKVKSMFMTRNTSKAKARMYNDEYLRQRLSDYEVDLEVMKEHFPDFYELLYSKQEASETKPEEKEQKDQGSEENSDKLETSKKKPKGKKSKKKT